MKVLKLVPLLLVMACSTEPDSQPTQPTIQPVVQPITQPIIFTEIQVMAPENPMVFYTMTEEWKQPEGTKRPVPETTINARVSFNPTGADNYNVIQDGSLVSQLSENSEQHRFTFKRPGLLTDVDMSTFPNIQIQAQTQDASAMSANATWQME